MDETFIKSIKDPDSDHARYWKKWLEDHPHKINEIEKASILVKTLQFDEKHVSFSETNIQWRKLKQTKHLPKEERSKEYSGYFKIAAAIAMTVVFAFLLNNIQKSPSDSTVQDISYKKETLDGQKLSVTLPDGSKVKLNSGSSVEYTNDYGKGKREVILHGEAFFEVKKNTGQPFIVKAGDITTEVLGTSFNINNYPESPIIHIALAEGKIRISGTSDNEDVLLDPGLAVAVNKQDRDFVVSEFDEETVIGWKDGILKFNTIPLEEALAKMERWYGVHFAIENKNIIDPSWRIHGKYKDHSLEYILNSIRYPDLFEFRIQEDTVVIY